MLTGPAPGRAMLPGTPKREPSLALVTLRHGCEVTLRHGCEVTLRHGCERDRRYAIADS
jgi:hypothetical protein